MGFTYPDKFIYLNTFMMEVAQRCSDNGGTTVAVFYYKDCVLVLGFMCSHAYTQVKIII